VFLGQKEQLKNQFFISHMQHVQNPYQACPIEPAISGRVGFCNHPANRSTGDCEIMDNEPRLHGKENPRNSHTTPAFLCVLPDTSAVTMPAGLKTQVL
jgi:hypothetical protein